MECLNKLLLLSVCLCAESAFCDYTNPPNWDGCASFTHQSWDFGKDERSESSLPSLPDGDPNYINSFGDPVLIDVSFTNFLSGWEWEYSSLDTDRRGLYGGMCDTTLTFQIPNTTDLYTENWKKKIWIQAIIFARNDNPQLSYSMEVANDQSFADKTGISQTSLELVALDEPHGSTGQWYRLTAVYELGANPITEYIRIAAYNLPISWNHPSGGASMFDEVDIDTCYVNIADINEDSSVDAVDFAIFASDWLKLEANLKTDLYADGSIDALDLEIFVENWLITP